MTSATITILIFIAMYQLASQTNIRPLVSAGIISVVPLLSVVIIRLLFGVKVLDLVSWNDTVTLLLQFLTVYAIFSRLHYDDSPTTWITWGAIGLIITAIVIPIAVIYLFTVIL